MNRKINLWMIGCLILAVLIFVISAGFIGYAQGKDKTIEHLQTQIETMTETPVLEAPYTMIINHSAVMYVS